jgi:hypothetical protein
MADFSLTTLFVSPVGNTLPSSGSTQDLTAGQLGFFLPDYAVATSGNIDDAGVKYFYVAQGRTNTYLQGSKRSDKIAGALQNAGSNVKGNVTEFYKVVGCPTPTNQITDVTEFSVKCGEIVTLTIRAFSSYLETLYFNGLTRSVTVNAPCCDCGADPCTETDVNDLIDKLIEKLEQAAPGINPDNIKLTDFFIFENVGGTILRIHGKPVTKYGQPCDVAAFPHEYDRLRFNVFVYEGPATTADFIVDDACDIVATSTVVQTSNYASGTPEEIRQLEIDYYSYQAGYLKHLNRMMGYNGNFESWVADGVTYDTFYIKFVDYEKSTWGDYVPQDSMVIIAVPTAQTAAVEAVLEAALGAVDANNECITTTTTTTGA